MSRSAIPDPGIARVLGRGADNGPRAFGCSKHPRRFRRWEVVSGEEAAAENTPARARACASGMQGQGQTQGLRSTPRSCLSCTRNCNHWNNKLALLHCFHRAGRESPASDDQACLRWSPETHGRERWMKTPQQTLRHHPARRPWPHAHRRMARQTRSTGVRHSGRYGIAGKSVACRILTAVHENARRMKISPGA